MGSPHSGRARVAFVCTHNACRSQMAEAIARAVAGLTIDPRSAGTDPAERVNPEALETLRRVYGIDGTSLHPKPLDELGEVDALITMGCGVQCPTLPCAHREDWGLEDPTDKGTAAFERTARIIERNVRDFAGRIRRGEIPGVVPPPSLEELRALADESRLTIVETLAEQEELCACKLLERIDVSQSTLSHHMGVLVACGLVRARKDGRWMHYSLNAERLAALGRAIAVLAE